MYHINALDYLFKHTDGNFLLLPLLLKKRTNRFNICQNRPKEASRNSSMWRLEDWKFDWKLQCKALILKEILLFQAVWLKVWKCPLHVLKNFPIAFSRVWMGSKGNYCQAQRWKYLWKTFWPCSDCQYWYVPSHCDKTHVQEEG